MYVCAYSHTKYPCAKETVLWLNVKYSQNFLKHFWFLSIGIKRCIDFGFLCPFRRNLYSSCTSVNNTGSFFSVEKMLDITILITSTMLFFSYVLFYFYVILHHNKCFCRVELSKCWSGSSSEQSSREGGEWAGPHSLWELQGHGGAGRRGAGDGKRWLLQEMKRDFVREMAFGSVSQEWGRF